MTWLWISELNWIIDDRINVTRLWISELNWIIYDQINVTRLWISELNWIIYDQINVTWLWISELTVHTSVHDDIVCDVKHLDEVPKHGSVHCRLPIKRSHCLSFVVIQQTLNLLTADWKHRYNIR